VYELVCVVSGGLLLAGGGPDELEGAGEGACGCCEDFRLERKLRLLKPDMSEEEGASL
jgi:hypothetical protein